MSETTTRVPVTTTAIELPTTGDPEVLRVVRRPLDAPGRDDVVVRVEATGISFAEQQMRHGKYYDQPPFPFVPGYDLVGLVETTGPDVDGLSPGDRVAAVTKTGAWADRVVLGADLLVPVPDGLDAGTAEAAVVNGVTAWRMLHRTARVRAGDVVLVLGAAGGVGSLLVQLAVASGARVVGVGSAGQQDAIAELGAVAVDYRAGDVGAAVRELAPTGAAAVFDHVGGPGIRTSWRLLARGGTLVSYGSAATKDLPGDPRLPVFALLARLATWNALPNGRRARFFDLWAGSRRHTSRYRRELRDDLEAVFALLRDGRLSARIAGEFALEDAAAALRFAEQGGLVGKVLLRP